MMNVEQRSDGSVAVYPLRRSERVPFVIELPPDKSLTHRALFLASMASGRSVIENPSQGADCLATRTILAACGVRFVSDHSGTYVRWVIESPGAKDLHPPAHPLDAANSGTTVRLWLGMSCALPQMSCDIVGDESLSTRPMARVTQLLNARGADISGKDAGNLLPLHVRGRSLPGFTVQTEIKSAQVKSALLFAALMAHGSSSIRVPRGSREHTESMLFALGAPIQANIQSEMVEFSVHGPWNGREFTAHVPGDPSALAFFAALACLHPGMTIVCKDVLANQGRLYFLEILQRAGLAVTYTPGNASTFPGEASVDVTLCLRDELMPLKVMAAESAAVIDEIPALVIASTAVHGESVFEGLEELRVKESDRLSELHKLLGCADIKSVETRDALTVKGRRAVKSFVYDSQDHRMVMAASILATTADNSCTISTSEAVKVSFPLFFDCLQQI